MSYVIGLFLAFSGMLFGYLLRYRDQSDEAAAGESLTRENEDLRTALRLAHQSNKSLDDRFVRQKDQMSVITRLCDEWSASRQQLQHEREKLETTVSDKSKQIEVLTDELQSEKRVRISLEDQAHVTTRNQVEEICSLENDWRTRHVETESQLIQGQSELEAMAIENARITEHLHQAESNLAGLSADLSMQESLFETATKNASGLEQEYTSLETALETNSQLLRESRSECAAALSEQKVAQESLAALKATHGQSLEMIDELRTELAELQSSQSTLESLERSRENEALQLEKVSLDRDQLLETEKSALSRNLGLQKQIDNQEATIRLLREKHDEMLGDLQQEIESQQEMEAAFEQESAGLIADKESLTSRLAEAKSGFENATVELIEAKGRTRELTCRVEELKTTCQRISELERLVQSREDEEQQVATELRELREQYASSIQCQHEARAQVEKASERNQILQAESEKFEDEIQSLQSELATSEETIRTLRHDQASTLTRLANLRSVVNSNATVISFTEAMAQRRRDAVEFDVEYRGPTCRHEIRGVVYTEAPEMFDDLKQISGIAEVLEARLNDYGIYTFKQMMEWGPEAVEEFSRLFAFKDRIERDHWIGQARSLYEQKSDDQQSSAA